MRAQERVRACRLIEKANRNKKTAEGLGVKNISVFNPAKARKEKQGQEL